MAAKTSSNRADESFLAFADAPARREHGPSNTPDFENAIAHACVENAPADLIISQSEKAFARSTAKRLFALDHLDAFCNVKEDEGQWLK